MSHSGRTSARGGLSEEDDLIPIRMVEAVVFCPRQAWYRFVVGEDPINVHMQRGLNRHETFGDQPGRGAESDERIWRHLPVCAPILGVAGVLDEVSITPARLVITEYKTTRRSRAVWEGVLMQLAVQHLALREHALSDAWQEGPLPDTTVLRVYYTDSRHTHEVPWDDTLAQRAVESVAICRQVLAAHPPPEGSVGSHCRECQHEPICLPFYLPVLKEAMS